MKLNLGCGNDYRQGWVNVDVGNCRKDLHHDLEQLPLPFADSTFSEVLMMHVLEHVDRPTFPAFMRELHRICRPDARIHIEVPYYNSKNAWTDFTHKNFFTEDSFGFFDRGSHLRENGVIYGIDFTFKVNLLGIDGNGTIKYDLQAEKLPRIATIINFCTLDSRFISACADNVRGFSEQILIVAASHFFDGTPEDVAALEQAAQDVQDDTTRFLILDYDHAKTLSHGSRYWHNFARWSGLQKLNDGIDHVLFLDADEIIEGQRFAAWLASGQAAGHDAVALAANWYFRDPSYRATSIEEAGLLVRRDLITEELIFDDMERWALLRLANCARFQKGLDGLPMLHHYSWVRTQEEMLRKVSAWGHNRDKDWGALVRREFEHGFSGRDFVHGYTYTCVEPYLSTGPAATMYQQATELIRKGEHNEAVCLFENLLETLPDHVPALNQLALLYYQAGEMTRALTTFEKSASLAAWEINTLKNLANLYFEMEDPGKALRTYQIIEALTPTDVEVLLSIGNLNYLLGQKDSAATYFLKILEIDRSNNIARQNIEILGQQHRISTQDAVHMKMIDVENSSSKTQTTSGLVEVICGEISQHSINAETIQTTVEMNLPFSKKLITPELIQTIKSDDSAYKEILNSIFPTLEPYNDRKSIGYNNFNDKIERNVKNGKPFEFDNMIVINRALSQFISDDNYKRIINIGGGTGLFEQNAALVYPQKDFIVSEFDQNCVEYFRMNFPLNNVQYCSLSAKDLIDKFGKFDAVLSVEVIEHVDNYGEFINDLLSLADTAIITTPNRMRTYSHLHSNPPDYYQHTREWTAGEFYWILKLFYKNVTLYGINGWESDEFHKIGLFTTHETLVAYCNK